MVFLSFFFSMYFHYKLLLLLLFLFLFIPSYRLNNSINAIYRTDIHNNCYSFKCLTTHMLKSGIQNLKNYNKIKWFVYHENKWHFSFLFIQSAHTHEHNTATFQYINKSHKMYLIQAIKTNSHFYTIDTLSCMENTEPNLVKLMTDKIKQNKTKIRHKWIKMKWHGLVAF